MTKKERNQIIKHVENLSNEELENEYYNAAFDCLGSQTDKMYELGFDISDILEQEKYEKYLVQKADLLCFLCQERGINLQIML